MKIIAAFLFLLASSVAFADDCYPFAFPLAPSMAYADECRPFKFLIASSMAYAGDCRPFTIFARNGEELHFAISSERNKSFIVGVYSGSKLIRTVVSRPDGGFSIGGLREGKYLLYVNGLQITTIDVVPRSIDPSEFLKLGPLTHPQPGIYLLRLPDSMTMNGPGLKSSDCPSAGFSTN